MRMTMGVLAATGTGVNRPTVPGTPYNGGYYMGTMVIGGVTYGLIVSPTASASRRWSLSPYQEYATGANSASDGVYNVAVLKALGISNFPAAEFCDDYANGGFSDFYLPSTDELMIVYNQRNSLPSGDGISGVLWSSREMIETTAYALNVSGGGVLGISRSTLTTARPVRRELWA